MNQPLSLPTLPPPTSRIETSVRSNPFATRHTRPGAIPYLFAPGENLETLWDQWNRFRKMGQIAGPHGSGKSTLLATIQSHWPWGQQRIEQYSIQRADDSISQLLRNSWSWSDQTQLLIDSFELLSWRHRLWVCWVARSRGCGLLVTTHRKMRGIPMLYRTQGDFPRTLRLVNRLLDQPCESIQLCDVRSSYQRHGANVREILFALYDLYEERRC